MSNVRVIGRVLVANRGEIACRVIKTCKRLGIATVAIFTNADKDMPYVLMADEAVLVGPNESSASYLNQDSIIKVAKQTHVDAIHPGYGFLSENSAFAARCEQEGLIFIGPSAASIAAIGTKKAAKQLLSSKHPGLIPVIPGYNGDDQSLGTLTTEALKVGFPLLIKASAGGGGKGMRIVTSADGLEAHLEAAKRESMAAFGDGSLLLERYFDRVKHIEVQIFGDNEGNILHLFERDCSVQRRYQKLIEETPADLSDAERESLFSAAILVGKTISYRGAGTVEFIFDQRERQFFFLEVNTRLQVEHPVTEMVTGLDLVELQIRVAEGRSFQQLGLSQSSIGRSGHAIECRVCCEDVGTEQFLPSTGRLDCVSLPPLLPGVRYDMGVISGSIISIYYDPMVGKLICHGKNRLEAIQKLRLLLAEAIVFGPTISTNLSLVRAILSHNEFLNGRFTTHFLQEQFPLQKRQEIVSCFSVSKEQRHLALATAALVEWWVRKERATLLKHVRPMFRNSRRTQPASQTFSFSHSHERIEVKYDFIRNADQSAFAFQLWIQDATLNAELIPPHEIIKNEMGGLEGVVSIVVQGTRQAFRFYIPYTHCIVLQTNSMGSVVLKSYPKLVASTEEAESDTSGLYKSPLSGKVRITVNPGDDIVAGQTIAIIESMKMETKLLARLAGVVHQIFVSAGDVVQDGQTLLTIKETASDI